MVLTIVKAHVKRDDIKGFIKAAELSHLGSIKEPGNVRIVVSQQEHDPSQFVLYEAFKNNYAIARHSETEHYL